jgi:hypothetical protein
MKQILLAAVFGAALLSSECGDLLSLHPLHTGESPVVDPAIEGCWETADSLLTVSPNGAAYEVTLRSKKGSSEPQEFEAHLTDLGGIRMADVVPTGGMLGHMFVRVRVSAAELRIAFLDSEWLRKRIPHEDVLVAKENKQAVLIARTPALRKQVQKYVAVPEAYGDDLVFRRVNGANPQ